jgi:hypothetical protein
MCTIRSLSDNSNLVSCSNVRCRKGRNKKVKKDTVSSSVCCHLRELLSFVAAQNSLQNDIDVDSEDSVDSSCSDNVNDDNGDNDGML